MRRFGKETYPITSADGIVQGASFDQYGNLIVAGVGHNLQIVQGKKFDETVVTIPNAH